VRIRDWTTTVKIYHGTTAR